MSTEEDLRKFRNLTRRWKEETFLKSSIDEIESNESYLQIINMGKRVLPFIFKDLKSEPKLWFSALEKITGCDPIEHSHKGFVKLMIEDWLRWGDVHGFNTKSNLAKCTFCDAEMIERTNDNELECLNCGAPFTMPVKSTVKQKRSD